jgi:hypothetical protein
LTKVPPDSFLFPKDANRQITSAFGGKLMSSIKCPSCGLVNFATALLCKRCKLSFEGPTQTETNPAPEAAPVPTQASSIPGSKAESSEDTQPDDLFVSAVRRDGKLLIMTEESVLPDRCVKCNSPAERQVKYKLNWVPNYVNIVAIFSWLLALLLVAFKKKTVTVHVGLCDKHFNRRIAGLFFGGGLVTVGLLMGVLAVFNQDYLLIVYGAGAGLIGAFFIALLIPNIKADRIEEPFVWVKGFHKDFLDTLPIS